MSTPTPNVVDLTSCDNEQINLIGAIQPHGALVAAQRDSLQITHASENISDFFPSFKCDTLFDLSLKDLLGNEAISELLSLDLNPAKPEVFRPWAPTSRIPHAPQQAFECLPHLYDGIIILEFVKADSPKKTSINEDQMRQLTIAELIRPGDLSELATKSAKLIRMITGFDRVMIYRFAEDKHGEVIAESTSRDDSFLGLHYPASDIPEPARQHFFRNVIRLIPSVSARPSPIRCAPEWTVNNPNKPDLDLSYSKLRAVSPVHVEYLGNMGVDASMSISLISHEKLWGLVACHHYSAKEITNLQIRHCEFLGATISSLLQSLDSTSHLSKSIQAEKLCSKLETTARTSPKLLDAIEQNSDDILALFAAQALVLNVGDDHLVIGHDPGSSIDFTLLKNQLNDGMFCCSNVSSILPLDAQTAAVAAGAAYLELSDDGVDHLVILRDEFEESIKWAGKPEKTTKRLADGSIRLSPRGSFALWREERLGHSRPFDESDQEALRILRRALVALNSVAREREAVRLQRTAEENQAKLRLALLDAARMASMGELASALAHELTQPLSAVTNYINASRQEINNIGTELSPQVSELMNSAVQESHRAANLVRRLRNFIAQGDLVYEYVDLHKVIKECASLAVSSGQTCQPDVQYNFDPNVEAVWADPVQIGLVILNLTRNSLSAMQSSAKPVLKISSDCVENAVNITVEDTGVGISEELREEIFEPFHTSTTNGMGIGLSLCRSIIEAHAGRIWATASSEGAAISFTLPIDATRHGKSE